MKGTQRMNWRHTDDWLLPEELVLWSEGPPASVLLLRKLRITEGYFSFDFTAAADKTADHLTDGWQQQD